jgi:phage-related protein
MSSIITSLKDLIVSLFEVIFSTFKSAFNGVYGIIHAFFGFFIDIIKMVLNTVKGTLEAAGGVGKFVASEYNIPSYSESLELTSLVTGNLLVILVIGAGAYGYLEYQRRQGRTVKAGSKKLN